MHICSKRYQERAEKTTRIKVYSTEKKITLIVNGKTFATKESDDHVFTFRVPMEDVLKVEAVCGRLKDTATFKKADKMPEKYILPKKKNKQKSNWV